MKPQRLSSALVSAVHPLLRFWVCIVMIFSKDLAGVLITIVSWKEV